MKSLPLALALFVGVATGRPAVAQVAEDVTAIAPNNCANLHASAESAISSDSVQRLAKKWTFDTPAPVTHQPIVHDGDVYFADWSGKVYRLSLESGDVVWSAQVETPRKKLPWYGFAGTGTIAGDLLIEASVEGNAFGIDRETGEVVWERRIAEQKNAGNLSKLLHHEGLVYVGLSSPEEMLDAKMKGFEPNFQGRILALDAKTGRTVWETPLAEKPHNGVSVWSGFALDPQTETLFVTTSNNYTGEPNELSDAFIALNAKTGDIQWVRQMTEHDIWTKENPIGPDYAFGAMPQLFEATIDGETVPLVGAGQKSGVYWALDRRTGEIVWSTVVGYGGMGGGIHAEASILDGSVFVWSNNSYNYGKPPEKAPMSIKRLDAATGSNVWALTKAQPASVPASGVATSDLYFVGSLDGMIRAYRTSNGKRVWTSPEGGGAIATPLVVEDDMLVFGTGVPKMFGGNEGGNSLTVLQLQD